MSDINESTVTKTRAPKTPRNVESITKGALSLGLSDRVELVEKLRSSIDEEVETMNAAAANASLIAKRITV